MSESGSRSSEKRPSPSPAAANGAHPGLRDPRTGGLGWQWMTVEEVARSIGLTEERVRQLIRERKIKATKIGGWLVQPGDLQVFIQSRTNVPGD